MSEQAKIVALQERIKETREKALILTISGLISASIAGGGVGWYYSSGGLGSLFWIIAGVVLMILCGMAEWSVNRTKKELLSELDSMAVGIPACPKCGKGIPKGNFAFCPFCGAAFENR